jgi:hypothetical protein
MPELTEIETPKTSGFVDRGYNYENKRKRMEQEEEEIKRLEAEQRGELESSTEQQQEEAAEKEEADTEVKEEALSAEEKSFKKRYGDLRRHVQNKEKEWEEKFKTLEDRLKKENIVPPKSDEDIEQWAKQYPDVAGIVETIAAKKAQEMFSKAEERLQKIDEEQFEAVKSKAEDMIRKSHSDFDQLRESDTFHNWVEEQPKWVQDALYENSDDAASVIRVIDLYKVDNGLTKSDYAEKRKAAAKSIKKSSKTKVDATESSDMIKESDVAKMSTKEFEEKQDEITKAMRSGKFIYDMSGKAR